MSADDEPTPRYGQVVTSIYDAVALPEAMWPGPPLDEDGIELVCEEYLSGHLALPVPFIPEIAACALRLLKETRRNPKGRPPGKPSKAAKMVETLISVRWSQHKARIRAAQRYRLDRKAVREAHLRLLKPKAPKK